MIPRSKIDFYTVLRRVVFLQKKVDNIERMFYIIENRTFVPQGKGDNHTWKKKKN